MWTLTGFADEISPDLDEQLDTLARESLRYLELRAVWGKNVLRLDDAELARVRQALDRQGVGVSSIGSPIGKIGVADDFAPHLEDFKRALHAAHVMGAPFVRIFSFYIPEGDDPARYRDEVLSRLGRLVEAADGAGVTLLHENERGIYGDTPARCRDLLAALDSPLLRAAWDPANFVLCGVRPYTEGYDLLRPYIAYVHVKDARRDEGRVVPAGQGDGEVRETLAALHDSGFDGFFSLEPHLKAAGQFSGFSGPALFGEAAQAFKALLRELDIPWR
ncbi:MAG TPA: sugar phosphate isomerase/epimerase family protein [Thermomicrobiales bacterium]|nr:sugar phosphate isomerase/epimerase family protein [Thermomicrobiales bacterium]